MYDQTPYELFPPLEPHAKGMLPVDDVHTLYWEECGNPNGVPVLFLHGGPGAGSNGMHRRFFDPKAYRIILFDQRGAGRSEPLAETRQNTTTLLVSDIEKLRQHRDVTRWHIFGGSWGSTLALSYAETHPEACLSMTLRGICLLQRREIEWFLYGIRNVFPEAWDRFTAILSPHERGDILAAYLRLFASKDQHTRQEAMATWSQYESSCSSLRVELPGPISLSDDRHRTGLAVLEAHYFKNNLFEPDSFLLDNINRIRHVPAVLVHGRYDMVCPVLAAHELHAAWPESELRIIPDAGHSALEPGIRSALIEATERFKVIQS